MYSPWPKFSFRWIFVYQDHLTKCVVLRALSSKRAAEVAHHLFDVFLLSGSQSIPQSNNGSEFTAEVINERKIAKFDGLWKEQMEISWICLLHCTNDWSMGIKYVQFQENSRYRSGIQRTPNAAMLWCESKVGLTSSSLSAEVAVRMQSGDDLISVIANLPTVQEHTNQYQALSCTSTRHMKLYQTIVKNHSSGT